MNSYEAQDLYSAAVVELHKYCEKETEFSVVVRDDEYPFRLQFIPDPQQTIFKDQNIDENGEVGDLTISVGLTTSVVSTLKFKMWSNQLKKLIKLSESIGRLYYQAFRERADLKKTERENEHSESEEIK